MKTKWKWILGLSIALNIILIIVLSSTSDDEEPVDLTIYTQQDISKSLNVQLGMNQDAVKNIMGPPIKRDINAKKEEWHFCQTGNMVDEYVYILFSKNEVTEVKNYTVAMTDIVGLSGSCELFVKKGSYTNTPNQQLKAGETPARDAASGAP